MSSPAEADAEDEVQFVSEAPLRPVLECIDLSSDDGEAEGSLPTSDTIEDEIDRQKAHVASTLERLARQVAVEKKERAEKCRAFKERQLSQKAHGQRELAFAPGQEDSYDAKRCVDMWLNMPGVKPGVLNFGMGRRRRSAPLPASSSSTQTCPVISCGRVYDNVPLLEGHLKRFDHSPCDPTIHLRGSPSEVFACVACGMHFPSQKAWKEHLQSKVSSSSPQGHTLAQSFQVIVCFACPACYLLFYIRDECLQHMAAKNHFTESISLSGDAKGGAVPVPIPRYAKNLLISLCKEVVFRVRCSICAKVLKSHMEAKAHFNVQCRQGCARVEADRTVAEVMRQLRVHERCPLCSQVFLGQGEVEQSGGQTPQRAEAAGRSMDRALLWFCSHCETQHASRDGAGARGSREARGPDTSGQDRRGEAEGSPAKRKKLGPGPSLGSAVKAGAGRERTKGSGSVLAWFCECGQRFSEEATASSHLLAANQIFHQCGVCGKQMGEAAIARLHMSRFHGGAHLSNFLFHCRKCGVDMPRHEDILSHVAEAHSGHAYFSEREAREEESAGVPYAKPSTSSRRTAPPESGPLPVRPRPQTWMCRMCEDVFDSEASVLRHCRDPSSHSFQRFVCGHCPQKFFKDATLKRHCVNEHGGRVERRYFCGLCDSMQYDTEEEFQEHYRDLHSKDFYCMEDPDGDGDDSSQAAGGAAPSEDLCPCMAAEKGKKERKATFTLCMKRLAGEGKCLYTCAPCGVRLSSFPQIKTHVHSTHPALGLELTFHVECQMCGRSHSAVPSFHQHYHSQHCPQEPCLSSRAAGKSRGPGEKSSTSNRAGKEGSRTGRAGEERSSGESYEGEKTGCGREEAAPPAVKTRNAVEIKPVLNDEMGDVKPAVTVSVRSMDKYTDDGGDSDEEMKRSLALSAEEARNTTDLDFETLKIQIYQRTPSEEESMPRRVSAVFVAQGGLGQH